jgi:hypothetical protein
MKKGPGGPSAAAESALADRLLDAGEEESVQVEAADLDDAADLAGRSGDQQATAVLGHPIAGAKQGGERHGVDEVAVFQSDHDVLLVSCGGRRQGFLQLVDLGKPELAVNL